MQRSGRCREAERAHAHRLIAIKFVCTNGNRRLCAVEPAINYSNVNLGHTLVCRHGFYHTSTYSKENGTAYGTVLSDSVSPSHRLRGSRRGVGERL